MKKIMHRGAEALIYLRDGKVVKERVPKGYRQPELDRKIRKKRTRAEAKLMERSRLSGASVPAVGTEDDFGLVMDNLSGRKVRDALGKMRKKERGKTCSVIGKSVASLHSGGIIHGDLTTSNMIMMGDDVFLIDFGLGRFSEKAEDQAVDLFLLYEVLKSTHFSVLEECWKAIIDSYSENYEKAAEVVARMEKIKKRRRYK